MEVFGLHGDLSSLGNHLHYCPFKRCGEVSGWKGVIEDVKESPCCSLWEIEQYSSVYPTTPRGGDPSSVDGVEQFLGGNATIKECVA